MPDVTTSRPSSGCWEAPTSLAAQSEVNADGFGIAALSAEAALLLIRNPVRAAGDREDPLGVGLAARHRQVLITLCVREAGGDVRAGVMAAVRELAEGYELYSVNFVLGEVGHLGAFRYPEQNPLLVLEHGGDDDRALVERDAHGTLSMRPTRAATSRWWSSPASGWTPIPAGRRSAWGSSSTSVPGWSSTARRS